MSQSNQKQKTVLSSVGRKFREFNQSVRHGYARFLGCLALIGGSAGLVIAASHAGMSPLHIATTSFLGGFFGGFVTEVAMIYKNTYSGTKYINFKLAVGAFLGLALGLTVEMINKSDYDQNEFFSKARPVSAPTLTAN